MPSLLCPLFRSKNKDENKNNKKKNKKTKHDRNPNNNAPSKNLLPHKSLVADTGISTGMPGKRVGNTDGVSPVYHSIGTDRSRSTMDTAKLSVLSLETNRRGNLRDDDSSLPTIDPDYNPTYDCFSLSDAGGTIGSQSLAATTAFGSATRVSSAFGSAPASYLERGLYNDATYNPLHYPGNAQGVAPHPPPPPTSRQTHVPPPSMPSARTTNASEPLLEIYAPPGKLGVVIDVPPRADTPVVHAIKDTCPIRNEILVGDRLLAVDDQDVTAMTAMEVSRLISRKSQQRARKLTIRRDRTGGAGGVRAGGGYGSAVGRGHDPRQLGVRY